MKRKRLNELTDTQQVALQVLVRLPLKIIARFRSVSKEWKALIDSDRFREHYFSTNSSSSVSWSIIQMRPRKLTLEIVGYHGCKTWGLNKTPGSLVQFFAKTPIRKLMVLACTDGLVLICAESVDGLPMYYIGNVLSKEWLRIHLPSMLSGDKIKSLRTQKRLNDSGLVTKMQNGIVVGYKVVWMVLSHNATKVLFLIYSSDSWNWDIKEVTCRVDGIESQDQARKDFLIISFPDISRDGDLPLYRRIITTSEASVVYLNEFNVKNIRTLRIWKLVKYTNGPDTWQLSWDVNMSFLISASIKYFPVVMHPLKSEIIYLWSTNMSCMLLFNLRTRRLFCHYEETGEDNKCMDGSILSFNDCSHYMNEIGGYFFPWTQGNPNRVLFTQFVLPRWFHRLPRPQPPP